jgi:hypothetical protein
LNPADWIGKERVEVFRKTEVGERHFRFLVVLIGGILEFPGENGVLGLVRRLHSLQVFEIKPVTKELDRWMFGA